MKPSRDVIDSLVGLYLADLSACVDESARSTKTTCQEIYHALLAARLAVFLPEEGSAEILAIRLSSADNEGARLAAPPPTNELRRSKRDFEMIVRRATGRMVDSFAYEVVQALAGGAIALVPLKGGYSRILRRPKTK